MRILIFHGYLLGGTGSNVYTARLAAALVALGHEVSLLTQERHPERQGFVDALGDWDEGELRVRALREQVRCTAYRPNIGGLLPVYVADRYEGIEARTFAECSDGEVAAYVEANVAAVDELRALHRPALALANHLVMGPVIVARGLRGEVPYAVKIHGSALEYTVKPEPERFLPYAREGLDGASGVLVGSRHTALSLWRALEQPRLRERTRLGPPGVDVQRFAPREPADAAAGIERLIARLQAHAQESPSTGADAFAREERAASQALAGLYAADQPLVAYVGKLILSKGVDLLLAAWPLVLARTPQARLVVVGFGAYRAGFERMCRALTEGDLDELRELARAGRALEGQTSGERASAAVGSHAMAHASPLRHLLAFLDGLRGAERERYLRAATGLGERVAFTGRLDHAELTDLLPACEAVIVPSTFPEAFGMVAAEAAACGALPISTAHSGLAEVSEVLAAAVPPPVAGLLSFPLDDDAPHALASRVSEWLAQSAGTRARARAALVATARERWSWSGVARGVIAAAGGELESLQMP